MRCMKGYGEYQLVGIALRLTAAIYLAHFPCSSSRVIAPPTLAFSAVGFPREVRSSNFAIQRALSLFPPWPITRRRQLVHRMGPSSSSAGYKGAVLPSSSSLGL